LTLVVLSFCESGWYAPLALNRDEGKGVHALRPWDIIFHRPDGVEASPANLQLRPMMAMGSVAQSGLLEPRPSVLPMVSGEC
jgi:hypothetical protein